MSLRIWTSRLKAGLPCRLLLIQDPEVKIPMVLDMIFARKWLDEKAEDDPEGRTNREIQTIVRNRVPPRSGSTRSQLI